MTTAGTIAVVAIAGVGVFVLLKIAQPSPVVAPSKAKSGTDLLSVNSLIGLGSSLVGLFGSKSSSSNEPTQADLDRIGFDTGNYTSSDGAFFTDANGTFIAG